MHLKKYITLFVKKFSFQFCNKVGLRNNIKQKIKCLTINICENTLDVI